MKQKTDRNATRTIMLKLIVLFTFIIILISCGKDENLTNPTGNELYDVVFDKTYDLSTGPSEASDIIETSQGGYLIAGRNKTGTVNHSALLRLDVNGNELWNKTYNNGRSLHSVIEVEGSGFVAVGAAKDSNYIVRTDYQGNIVWEVQHYFQYSDDIRKVIKTKDGGFLAIANSYATSVNARLLKLNSSGTINWVTIIQGNPAVKVYSVKENADSTISLFGTSKTTSNPESWFLTLDKNGNELTRKSITGSIAELGYTFYEYSVHQTSSGYFAGCGVEFFFLFESNGNLVIKRAVQPTKNYYDLRMYSLVPSLSNGFVACGHQNQSVLIDSVFSTKSIASLFLFNSSGAFSKSVEIGDTSGYNSATSVIEANDNSIVCGGYKTLDGLKTEIWVKKIKLK